VQVVTGRARSSEVSGRTRTGTLDLCRA